MEEELEPQFSEDDCCAECDDPAACVRADGCLLEINDAEGEEE